MKSKLHQSYLRKFEDNNLESSYCWKPERVLEMMKGSQETIDDNWVDEGLPKVVDEIMENYETYVGMSHMEGTDLPSKQVVVEVLEELVSYFSRLCRKN